MTSLASFHKKTARFYQRRFALSSKLFPIASRSVAIDPFASQVFRVPSSNCTLSAHFFNDVVAEARWGDTVFPLEGVVEGRDRAEPRVEGDGGDCVPCRFRVA